MHARTRAPIRTEPGPPSHEMNPNEKTTSLDPENWDDFRALSHQMLDDVIDYVSSVRERPAWQSPPEAAREAMRQPLPRGERDLAVVYEDFKQHIFPYPNGNIHPRFWGWVMGNGTAVGLMSDLLASAMNCNVSGLDQSPTLVENQVFEWLAEMLDFPKTSSGLLVSGGTVANLIGLAVARNTRTGFPIRKEGLHPETQGRLTVYASVATHGWLDSACGLLGLGESAFRKIATNNRDQVDVDALRAAIAADRAAGATPFCIVGTAGTVSTGATDDLNALANLAEEEQLWFHIDGAFGALAKLSPKFRYMVDGLERADSIAFDLHKWGYMQYETGAVLVRDAIAHKDAFSFAPAYLETFSRGIGIEPSLFASRGIQLSRSFRALRVWMNLATYGVDRIGAAIERNIEDAQYLRSLIEAEPRLELLGPAEMNVVCFRFQVAGMSETELDEFNRELLVKVQESGVAVPSNARIGGKFAIRVAHVNFRTIRSDFDLLIATVLSIADSLQ